MAIKIYITQFNKVSFDLLPLQCTPAICPSGRLLQLCLILESALYASIFTLHRKRLTALNKWMNQYGRRTSNNSWNGLFAATQCGTGRCLSVATRQQCSSKSLNFCPRDTRLLPAIDESCHRPVWEMERLQATSLKTPYWSPASFAAPKPKTKTEKRKGKERRGLESGEEILLLAEVRTAQ